MANIDGLGGRKRYYKKAFHHFSKPIEILFHVTCPVEPSPTDHRAEMLSLLTTPIGFIMRIILKVKNIGCLIL